ncbi:carbamate kinase [uncultured Gimesia sp.]|uniref:carbamate kinase n=1 Tax=uncultured Gimesia sp. TaxID=1678688 RepID=UPI0030DB7B3A|tara:strand:+ start:43163 stop:44101 length:939 start_codon:yes stop_codon:yes gene_type:complete
MTERTILALGGNAFAAPGAPLTMARQFEFAKLVFQSLSPLLLDDRELIISHGNGPQVGHMLIRVEEALGKAYAVPLEVCVAESEGELGYVITQTLHNVLDEAGRHRPIASILTQVVVDQDDPAFQHPTKAIGPFYTSAQADEVHRRGFPLRKEAERGFRRIVPSPHPREIVDVDVIESLLRAGVLVVAAGGGGIPVIREGAQLRGVEAVVDKDLTSALLGTLIEARLLLILTDVPCAYLNFNTPDQTPLGRIGITEAQQLLDEAHFGEGSMQPKIEAGIQFSRRPDCRTIICNVDNLDQALQGLAGTIIEHD